MPEAVIVSAARTPIGRANKGSLKEFRPDDLAAFIVRTALDKIPDLETLIAFFRTIGTISSTYFRTPVTTSKVMIRPSVTTTPIASGNDSPWASVSSRLASGTPSNGSGPPRG